MPFSVPIDNNPTDLNTGERAGHTTGSPSPIHLS